MVAGCGEFRPADEVTLSVRVITRTGSRRVARAAFELARQRRRRLTCVHKDTVFKLGCGMSSRNASVSRWTSRTWESTT